MLQSILKFPVACRHTRHGPGGVLETRFTKYVSVRAQDCYLTAALGIEPYSSELRPLYRPLTPWLFTVCFTQSTGRGKEGGFMISYTVTKKPLRCCKEELTALWTVTFLQLQQLCTKLFPWGTNKVRSKVHNALTQQETITY